MKIKYYKITNTSVLAHDETYGYFIVLRKIDGFWFSAHWGSLSQALLSDHKSKHPITGHDLKKIEKTVRK